MQRRKFLKSLALSPVLVAGADANLDFSKIKGKASIIDLDRCDGCTGFDVPKCVSACKEKNAARFPKPVEEIPNYFPRKINEDYSQKQNNISRLSPYNWTFVEVVAEGKKSACETQCPKNAIIFDDKAKILNLVEKAKKQGKFIYGDTQNGGTSTFYISSVDFTKIDEVIVKKYENTGQVGRPHIKVKVDNFINEDSTLIKGVLTAPLVGVVAGAKARKIKKEEL